MVTTNHAYPRPGDPIFNKSVKIERVTANTFEFNALQGTHLLTLQHIHFKCYCQELSREQLLRVVVTSHTDSPATSNGVEVSGN